MPEIGEIIPGSKTIRRKIWLICPECNSGHWANLSNYLNSGNRPCRICHNKRVSTKCRVRKDYEPGKTLRRQGYIFVRLDVNDPYHSMAEASHFVAEHRLVMAKYLGRVLTRDEIVHHINGKRDDNALDNLRIVSRAEHLVTGELELRKTVRLLQWQIKQLQSEIREIREALQWKLEIK